MTSSACPPTIRPLMVSNSAVPQVLAMTAKAQPVSGSSFIAGIGYDPDTQLLTLQFTDGGEWEYNDVDSGTYDELIQSSSMGQFFHSRIKGQYSGRRV